MLANPTTCGAKQLDATLTPWSGTAPKTAQRDVHDRRRGLRRRVTAPAFAPPAGRGDLDRGRAPRGRGDDGGLAAPTATQDLTRSRPSCRPGWPAASRASRSARDARGGRRNVPGRHAGRRRSSALAGSGDAPVRAQPARSSLTGPTDGGLAGLAIAIPGKVGPVDLGTVDRAREHRAAPRRRPDRRAPARCRGSSAACRSSIRKLALTLDRPGFILNASSCAAQQVTAVLDGDDGATATVDRALPGDRLRRACRSRRALEATRRRARPDRARARSRRCAP